MNRIQLTIPAIDVRPGDLVDLPVEKEYIVRLVGRAEITVRTPAGIRAQGGWVVLGGVPRMATTPRPMAGSRSAPRQTRWLRSYGRSPGSSR
jgi:hypothetical protein